MLTSTQAPYTRALVQFGSITASKLEYDFKLANTESTLWLGIKYFCIQAIIIHNTGIITQCRISVYQCRSKQDVGGSSSLQGTCTLVLTVLVEY